jgi:hypothetical protein
VEASTSPALALGPSSALAATPDAVEEEYEAWLSGEFGALPAQHRFR